jgi:uncharacterized protein DUF4390
MPPSLRIDHAPVTQRRRFLIALIALSGSAWVAQPVAADEIPVKSASLRIVEDEVLLTAEFDLSLTPALEQALDKGVALYFTIDFELSRTRAFWFPEKLADWSITYRVSYSALTRQYRVASGPLGQTFESLDDVERFIGHVASRPVAQASELVRGASYEAAVRMKLDVNQLPKPFQLNALASREWQLASDWYRFGFTPS